MRCLPSDLVRRAEKTLDGYSMEVFPIVSKTPKCGVMIGRVTSTQRCSLEVLVIAVIPGKRHGVKRSGARVW
jgi:hypothetical protein